MLIGRNAGLGEYPDSDIQCWGTVHRYCSLTRKRYEPVKRLQRAIDALVNVIPLYNVEGEIRYLDATIDLTKLPRDPIKNSLTGIDGKVGPDTLTWWMACAGVANQLSEAAGKPNGYGIAAQQKAGIDQDRYPRPLVRYAEELAPWLEDVAANFSTYYSAWKRSKVRDPLLAPPPMIIQTNQPFRARPGRWKTAGIAMAGIGLVALLSWGLAKYNEKHASIEM